MKRILSVCLTLTLCLGLTGTALAADNTFPVVNQYTGFSDVKDGDWYAVPVRTCFETGLMTGTDDGFQPNKVMTIAEAASIAARLHDRFNGGDGVLENPAGAGQWYDGAIAAMGQLANQAGNGELASILDHPEETATRGSFLALLALAAPEDLLSPINHITALPDTADPHVLAFYNAGILTGVNDYGTFQAGKTLTRAEVAAMAARVVRPETRQSFTPKVVTDPFDQAFDPCQYLLGVPGSATYFTCNGLSVTAGNFLNHAIDTANQLYQACQEQGVDFAWSNTTDGTDFLSFVYSHANALALEEAWSQCADPIALSEAAGTLKAKHILVKDKGAAEGLYAQLQADPTLFDALQAAYSEDGRDENNDLHAEAYVFGPGYMISVFEEGTKALKPGEIGAPVQSEFGWHIIQRLPLTRDDAWKGFLEQARISFGPDFPTGMDVKTAYTGWRQLVYEA